MNSWFNSWRAALRIARRDAWRYKGRSTLVLAMIALPIMGVSAVDITYRSSELTAEQTLDRNIGAADARLSGGGYGNAPMHQGLEEYESLPAAVAKEEEYSDTDVPQSETDVTKGLPAGAKSLEDRSGTAKVSSRTGLMETEVRELRASDPMAAGIMTLDRGRFPAKADEVMANEAFLEKSGLFVGSRTTARDLPGQYRIVGAYELPGQLKAPQLNALPGAFLEPYEAAARAAGNVGGDAQGSTYLVGVEGDFSWEMVKEANTKGVLVHSRAVVLDPPQYSEVPLYVKFPEMAERYESSTAEAVAMTTIAMTVVSLAMLEICLLAGPAFAVGARRSRRQLGLVGANGGDRRHIRAIVLGGGLVIGVSAAVVGTALGVILTVVLRPFMEEYSGSRFGGLELFPLDLLGIGLLGVITGLAAAAVPAVVASRQSVLQSLTGRRGVRRANRVLPVVGLVAIAVGVAVAVFGSKLTDSVVAVGGGSALAELGVVALTPTLVGAFGRISKWLPLSPRLALRDAVRNRGRTAPAVAAVLAAVAGTVAVATYSASIDQQRRDDYQASLPYGSVSMSVGIEGGRDVDTVRAEVEKHFPVTGRADVGGLLAGENVCTPWGDNGRVEGCGAVELITPQANECPLWGEEAEGLTRAEQVKYAEDWRCLVYYGQSTPAINTDFGVLVGGPEVLETLGVKDPAAERALARGEMVTYDKQYVEDGRITLNVVEDANSEEYQKAMDEDGEAPGEKRVFTAHLADKAANPYGISLLLSPAAAEEAGFKTVSVGSYFTTERMPTDQERQELDGAVAELGVNVSLTVEEGYVSDNSLIMMALAVFAGLVTIGAAGIATGLAQADAEPDLKTLSAVGASPRVRRTLSGFQCGVVAVMGVVLGSAAGLLPAVGLLLAEENEAIKHYRQAREEGQVIFQDFPDIPIPVPWETLGVLLVGVPLGAALLAMLVTSSQAAVARREA